MSKRTKTDSAMINPRNFWPTPPKAIRPLGRILPLFTVFEEPCAGDGVIIRTLGEYGMMCGAAYDILPLGPNILFADATKIDPNHMIITNPPYAQNLLQPLLDHWIGRVECWLLLPIDMIANVWTNPYMAYVDQVLPVGRISWLQNGKGGFENYGWFHFATTRQGLILHR